MAGEFAGKVKFVKVDIEEAEEVAAGFGVFAVPTVIFFRNGQPVDKLTGLVAKPKIVERTNALLKA